MDTEQLKLLQATISFIPQYLNNPTFRTKMHQGEGYAGFGLNRFVRVPPFINPTAYHVSSLEEKEVYSMFLSFAAHPGDREKLLKAAYPKPQQPQKPKAPFQSTYTSKSSSYTPARKNGNQDTTSPKANPAGEGVTQPGKKTLTTASPLPPRIASSAINQQPNISPSSQAAPTIPPQPTTPPQSSFTPIKNSAPTLSSQRTSSLSDQQSSLQSNNPVPSQSPTMQTGPTFRPAYRTTNPGSPYTQSVRNSTPVIVTTTPPSTLPASGINRIPTVSQTPPTIPKMNPPAASKGIGKLGIKSGIGLLLGVMLLLLLPGGLLESASLLPPYQQVAGTNTNLPNTTGGDISACTFYRGGDKVDGLQIANPLLSNLIIEVSTKVGVPAAIVASIMRVETASAITSTSDYLTNDYDAHCSLPSGYSQTLENCTNFGIAFGVMQFTPNTFNGTFNNNKEELKTLFGKTESTTTLATQNNMDPANILRIYSIRDSITAAAFKIKADKQSINGDGPWDENTIKEIAKRYYGTNRDGTTNYPGWDGSVQNYGEDLWKSYSQCQTSQGLIADLTCPVPNGKITCASYGPFYNSSNGFSDICRVDNDGNGGHCSNNYISYLQSQNISGVCSPRNQPGTNLLAREAYAIDVVGPESSHPGDPVYLPLLDGKSLKWFYRGNVQSAGGGYIRLFQSESTPEGVWSIQFSHVHSNVPQLQIGHELISGQQAAAMFDLGSNTHVHITVGVDLGDSPADLKAYSPGWRAADRQLRMCVN